MQQGPAAREVGPQLWQQARQPGGDGAVSTLVLGCTTGHAPKLWGTASSAVGHLFDTRSLVATEQS